jgi:CDP-diacylglycerol---serine O-phosphatidyltransferase
LNLISGCIACIFILQTGEMLVAPTDEASWVAQLPEKMWWGSVMIGIAAVVDFLDGFVARLFKATSAMGAQLDSLADMVSFGVAPGLIFYQLLRITFFQNEAALDTSFWVLAPAFVFPAAAAWRLARFNIESSFNDDFTGVPSPAAGLFVASLPLILFYNYFNIASVLLNPWVLYLIILLLSYLMISRSPFLALKFKGGGLKNNLPKIILVIVAIIAAIFLQWLAVPVVFFFYLVISLTTKKQLK